MTRRQKRRLAVSSAIMLAVALGLTASFLGVNVLSVNLLRLQRQLSDVLFAPRVGNPEVSRFIVVVGVDDKSVVELRPHGRLFNWPRSFYADVVRQLSEARARAIMFDILFDSPAEGDEDLVQALAAAQQRATSVVMPMAGDFLTRRETGRWETYGEVFEPLPSFKDAVSGLGMAHALPDPDGTVRRQPLVFDVRGESAPSLSLMAAAKFLRRPEAWDGPIGSGAIPLAGRGIPIDDNGMIIINYAGGPHESALPAFPFVSFVDVMNGRVDPSTFQQKLVLIGVTATAFADDYWTPPSDRGKMDGVEIHANAIDTILRGEFLRESPRSLTIGLILAFALLAGSTLMVLPPFVGALIGVLALGAFVIGAGVYFDQGGVILNLVYPPLSLLLTFAGIMLHRIVFEQGQTRAMRGLLGQYLSPSVVAEVARDPESLKLGGDQREMTVLFSDIRGFTTVSESLNPEQLVQLLTEYLTAMSAVVFKYDGTIDKYMGDAIMAFWGAPKRQDDHARLAVQVALEMVTELERLNVGWIAEGRPPLAIGIGLNTGQMKVGNMGSATRFDYTVMGDAVNLGSRLEGLNKEYGTTVTASAATLAAAGDGFKSRFLDLVAVKGKTEPVEVFEVMPAEGALVKRPAEALRAYDEGIRAYRERDWLGAAARFQEALRRAPNDGPSTLYLERCKQLMDEPPPADWDGVFVMTHK